MSRIEGRESVSGPSEPGNESAQTPVPADDMSVVSDTIAGRHAIAVHVLCFFLLIAARWFKLDWAIFAAYVCLVGSLWQLAGLRTDAEAVRRTLVGISVAALALAIILRLSENRIVWLPASAAFFVLWGYAGWQAYRRKGLALETAFISSFFLTPLP